MAVSGRQEYTVAGTLADTQLVRPQPALSAGQAFCSMPFIDDDLLWCPDNDGKMVDLSQLASSEHKILWDLKKFSLA